MVRASVADLRSGALATLAGWEALRGDVPIEVSDLEVRRSGPTYTVDTLEHLRSEDPERSLVLILGADAAAGISTWHRFRDLPGLCEIAVVQRPGSVLRGVELPGGLPYVSVEAPLVDVSSSDLRRLMAAGGSVGDFVTPGAISVSERRGLYAGTDDGD